jgi:hypothetical protein
MADIRPFERSDLEAVAALMRGNMANWQRHEAFLAGTLLDHPWTDPELPSLVTVDDGEVRCAGWW